MVGNDANANMSSLTTCLSHAVECLNIFLKHPEWDRGPRRLKLPAVEDGNGDVVSAVDHISPSSWKGDVSLESVVPLTAWNNGRHLIEREFASLGVAAHFEEMEKKGIDMLFPFGTLDNLDDNDDEPEDNAVLPESQDVPLHHVDLDAVPLEEDNEPLSFADHPDIEETQDNCGKFSPYVDVGGGKMVSKARVLRELERATFSRIPGSTDRLIQVAGGTQFSSHSNSTIVELNSIFGPSTVCVGDPAGTIIICEGLLFLAVIHINDIIVDFNACVDIDVKMLMEPTVTIQFQICQLVEMREEDPDSISGTEWRWNRVMESKNLKTCGAFIQVIDPVILTEKIGEPIYSFRSADLRALGASLLGSISLEDRARLPSLRKWTSHFPYRSGGKLSVLL